MSAPAVYELGAIACIRLRTPDGTHRLLSGEREIYVFPSFRVGWRVHDRWVGLSGGEEHGPWRPTPGLAVRRARRMATELVGSGEYVYDTRCAGEGEHS